MPNSPKPRPRRKKLNLPGNRPRPTKPACAHRLSQQLNSVLQTRDSARGLIVNMSDVLFDTAQFTLKPGAREKLAKVAGILLAYPGLNIEVDGHTDNVGATNTTRTSPTSARSPCAPIW